MRQKLKEVDALTLPTLETTEPLAVPNPSKFDSQKANDLNLPITLQKGVRSCTSHPIFYFVSLHRLSPSFHAFTSPLSYNSIPKNLLEAMAILEWKNVVFEEM